MHLFAGSRLSAPVSSARADVFTHPTTSTNGMIWGGLNGCPTTTRPACLHFDCMTLGVIPDELDAMIDSLDQIHDLPV